MKTIGAVIHVPSMRREIAAKPSRTSARIASCQCICRASQRSAPHVLEPDGPSQPVERAVERVVERSRAADTALEVERPDDERPVLPL